MLTHKLYLAALLTHRPELMVQELSAETLKQGLEWADVVVIGPGLGQDEWGKTRCGWRKIVTNPCYGMQTRLTCWQSIRINGRIAC